MNAIRQNRCAAVPFNVEPLEGRTLFSTAFLPWVALHEFGHSLGLAHINDPNSIMNPYVNLNYDMANFASDPAVATLQAVYSNANVAAGTTPWKDALDGAGDGVIGLTYSFIPDGTTMENNRERSKLFATFNTIFGSPDAWKPHFADALARWAGVSNGVLTFTERADAGKKWGYVGKSQNDPYSGDIRIGTHPFDGPGAVVAHAYYPATGGNKTYGGDAHFDESEAWGSGLAPATPESSPTFDAATAGTTGTLAGTGGDDAATLLASQDDVLTGRAGGLGAVFA